MSTERVCEWDALPNPTFNFWTTGNVSEVVPGVVRPLVATMYQQADAAATRALAETLDVPDLVPSYPSPTGNFLAVYAGRYALNLAWANALIATWTVAGASGLMDQYITSTDGQDITAAAGADAARAQQVWRTVRRYWGQLPRHVAGDRRRALALRTIERGRDLAVLSDRQLWRHVGRLRRAQEMPFMRHLGVSGAAGDHTDRLNKLLERAFGDQRDPALVIMLTSALRGVESAGPARGAWDVARAIAARPALAATVRRMEPGAIAAAIAAPEDADWAALATQFATFMDEYGFRGQREVDPSAADWEEAPAFAISTIKSYLDAPAERDPYDLEEASAQQREAIEAQVMEAMPRALRREYLELLAGAQRFTRMRESTKANWVRLCRLLRRPLRELGSRFAERGLIEQADDIFWLVESEVNAALDNRLAATTAREAVARRKAEAERLEQTTLPDVFITPVTPEPIAAEEAEEGNVLMGMPVSAGLATGRARVVLSVEAATETELEPGEVLVAPFTDAPWTPLFIPAAAVVVETGGMLSHAATVAREFGIPAVVAVKGATHRIRTGQLVTVDGMTGAITVGQESGS